MSAGARKRRRMLRRSKPVRIRAGAAGSAAAVGVYWLAAGRDQAFGSALLIFGAFAAGHLGLDVLVATAAASDSTSDDTPSELVHTYQTAVLTLAGTTLGLLAAFSQGELPLATEAAVVSLVGAALVQLVMHASGAGDASDAVGFIGLVGDLVAFWLLSFGLISLAASLVAR